MLYATLLWQQRKILCDQEAMDRERVNGNHNIGHIRFLVESYRPTYFYFEVVECFRRLLLASVIGIIASEKSSASSLLGLLISSLFIYVFSKQEPFNIPDDNDLSVVLSYSLMLMFLAALLIKVSVVQDNSRDQQVFGVVLIVVFLAGPASMFAQLTKGFIVDMKQKFAGIQRSKRKTDSPSSNDTSSLENSLERSEPRSDEESAGTTSVNGESVFNKAQLIKQSSQHHKETKRPKPVQTIELKTSDKEKHRQYCNDDITESPKSPNVNEGNHQFATSVEDSELRGPSSSRSRDISKKPPPRRLSSFKFSEKNNWLFATQSPPSKNSRPSLTKRMSFSENSSDVNGIFSSSASAASVPEQSSAKKIENLKDDSSYDLKSKPKKSVAVIARSINKSSSKLKTLESELTNKVKQDSLLEATSTPSSTLSAVSPQRGSLSRNPRPSKPVSPLGTTL
jgi:hypothetical protein